MKIDRTHRSPNFGPRPGPPDAIIVHDTASDGIASPLDWTCRRESGVSYHYLVDRDGSVYETVDPAQRAWHAGRGELWGATDPNNWSIGIAFVDIDRPGVPLDPYPEAQLDAAAELAAELCARFRIPLNRIVGHQHTAPGRKVDPGSDFQWWDFLLEIAFRLGVTGSPLAIAQHQQGDAA